MIKRVSMLFVSILLVSLVLASSMTVDFTTDPTGDLNKENSLEYNLLSNSILPIVAAAIVLAVGYLIYFSKKPKAKRKKKK